MGRPIWKGGSARVFERTAIQCCRSRGLHFRPVPGSLEQLSIAGPGQAEDHLAGVGGKGQIMAGGGADKAPGLQEILVGFFRREAVDVRGNGRSR